MKKVKKNNRDVRIEIARLIACLIVLCCHSYPPSLVDGSHAFGRVLIASLFADGVAIFWMVTGCFLFSSTYGKTLKNAITRIFIPLLLASALGILVNIVFFADSVPLDWHQLASDFLHWKNGVAGMDHLWYLYVNLVVIVFFPLLKLLVKLLDKSKAASIGFMILTLGFFIVNDFTSNQLAGFSHYLVWGAVPAAIEMIWGHILYRNRRLFANWLCTICSFILFFAVNYLRTVVQMRHYAVDMADSSALYWYSAWGLLAAVCVMVFSLSLFKTKKKKAKQVSKSAVSAGTQLLITSAASYTFMIYILHFPILRILSSKGWVEKIRQYFFSTDGGFISSMLATLALAAVLFVLSFILSWLIRKFWQLVKKQQTASSSRDDTRKEHKED